MKFKHLLAMMAFISASLIASASHAIGNITSITAPASAAQGASVSVTVNGTGTCEGGYIIYWNDGSNNVVPGPTALPHAAPSHSWSTTGYKTISVDGGTGCSGGATTQIQINNKPPMKGSTISSISGPNTARWGSYYRIQIMGSGKCNLRVDWGDGTGSVSSSYDLSAPRYLSHKYKLRLFPIVPIGFSKTFTIKVTPMPTGYISFCRGSASKSVRVGGLVGVAPNPAIRKSPAIKKSPGVRYQVK